MCTFHYFCLISWLWSTRCGSYKKQYRLPFGSTCIHPWLSVRSILLIFLMFFVVLVLLCLLASRCVLHPMLLVSMVCPSNATQYMCFTCVNGATEENGVLCDQWFHINCWDVNSESPKKLCNASSIGIVKNGDNFVYCSTMLVQEERDIDYMYSSTPL